MRIALVGGGGFVGHHLALRLRRDGHNVLIADHLGVNNHLALLERRPGSWTDRYLQMVRSRADLWNGAGVDFVYADATHYHGLSRKLSEWQPAAIVHLAAVAHITVSRTDKYLAWESGVGTLRNSLDVAVALNVKRFVYFSSSTVYGNFQKPVVTEADHISPDTRYGNQKAQGELMVKAEAIDNGLDYTIVRPQALYGPRCVSRRVTQIFIENALDGKPLRIDGDGSAMHDFTHVDDLVEGVAAIFSHMDESKNETFCLTAGQARSLLNLAQIVKRNIPCEFVYADPDPEKPSRGTMSHEKAERLLGWKPKYDLDEGMKMYCDWYKEFLT